jgi:Proline racemase
MTTADTPTPVARDATPAGSWEPATRPFNLAARLPAGTRSFRTIESHTAGNPTRTVLSGVPELSGATMLERMGDLAAHHDWVRSALMFEPRGGPVMSGCVLQAPTDPRADIGVLFIEASGHLPMCGHDTIGLVTVLLEAGLVEAAGPVTPWRRAGSAWASGSCTRASPAGCSPRRRWSTCRSAPSPA